MNIEIVVGSVLGASEYVAEALEQTLQDEHTVKYHFQPTVEAVNFDNLLIVVTSTHGAGDLPDNIQAFADHLSELNLSKLQALVIGLGDSSYDTFCEGASKMAQVIEKANGKLLLPIFQIDVLHHPIPEDIAVNWLQKNLSSVVSQFNS